MKILKNILEFLKSAKREEPRPFICPRCGSTRIYPITTITGWLTPEEYICDNCSYRGVALEVREDSSS